MERMNGQVTYYEPEMTLGVGAGATKVGVVPAFWRPPEGGLGSKARREGEGETKSLQLTSTYGPDQICYHIVRKQRKSVSAMTHLPATTAWSDHLALETFPGDNLCRRICS